MVFNTCFTVELEYSFVNVVSMHVCVQSIQSNIQYSFHKLYQLTFLNCRNEHFTKKTHKKSTPNTLKSLSELTQMRFNLIDFFPP